MCQLCYEITGHPGGPVRLTTPEPHLSCRAITIQSARRCSSPFAAKRKHKRQIGVLLVHALHSSQHSGDHECQAPHRVRLNNRVIL